MSEKKSIQAGFTDNRNSELREKIENVIYDYGPETGMTYAAVIGVLQMMIMDIYNSSTED